MSSESARIAREKRTIRAMIRIHCRARHGRSEAICRECGELLDYALERLDRCPFGSGKTACADCEIHCYRPAMRDRVRDVMRYAGPRMLWKHPLLALLHMLDSHHRGTAHDGRSRGGRKRS